MKLSELLERLDEIEGDPEVRIATQPNYPIATTVANVRVVDGILFIAEGSSPYDAPYAPRAAWVVPGDWGDEDDED